jgi:hypothetical protein
MSRQFKSARNLAATCALCIALAAAVYLLSPVSRPTGSPKAPSLLVASSQAASAQPPPSKETNLFTLLPGFRIHPFQVVRESVGFQWTAEDGRNTNILRQLAHNELEFQRMADESSRIYHRQLVYHKETADAQVQRSRLTGEPIRQLALPGLDGQEFKVEITRTDLNPSGQQGTFAGHLVGRLDSFVTFAFKGGREAFTILSPADSLYLQADPREPGELLVKSIDPQNYIVGNCGNP